MTPQTSEHPYEQRDTCCSAGVSPSTDSRERLGEFHAQDSPVAQAVPEIEHFLAALEFRQTLWYRAFYRQILAGVSILYPHVSASARAKMARKYADDLVGGSCLRALQSLAMPGGHVSFAQESDQSRAAPVRTIRQEMERFCAACRTLLALLLPRCWRLARWCLYHCIRLFWRALTGLCRIIIGLLQRRYLVLEDQEFFTPNCAMVQRITHRRWRKHRKKNPTLAVRRFRYR
ncbi:MAG: hypothetical protein KBE65_17720 [Phycisphaerae bacterium]|nr:hypothetical protein [Phycisphaerae bacterium]